MLKMLTEQPPSSGGMVKNNKILDPGDAVISPNQDDSCSPGSFFNVRLLGNGRLCIYPSFLVPL